MPARISPIRKQFIARYILFLAIAVGILAIPASHRRVPSLRIVRADGAPILNLFEGVHSTKVGISMRDAGRAQAKSAKRARRPYWLNEFLDVFDDNVVYAQGSSCSMHNVYVPSQAQDCSCNGTNVGQYPCTADQNYEPFCQGCDTSGEQPSCGTTPCPQYGTCWEEAPCCGDNSDCGCDGYCSGGDSGGTCIYDCRSSGMSCGDNNCGDDACCGDLYCHTDETCGSCRGEGAQCFDDSDCCS